MKVRIVVPGGAAAGEPLSGGDLYDELLARELRALGHDAAVCAEPEEGAVHFFDGLGVPTWGPRIARVPGVKVALLHQPVSRLDDGARHHAAEVALLAGCQGVHFASARAAQDARACHSRLPHHWVAPPGVDHFTPLPPRRERHFVGLGHVWERKGVLEALELVAKLPGEWHFDWLGALDVDTAYTARVLRRRAELKLETRVTFHGRTTRAQVADFLSRSSACLATARYESWGIALAEALRAGVPVVGNTVAGVLEFLGGQGWRADALTALPSLLDNTTEGQALREEAQVAAKRLPTWADCAAITARELEALCARE